MPKKTAHDFMSQPVSALARKNFVPLQQDVTVREALDRIRSEVLNEMIIYFYVVDECRRAVCLHLHLTSA